MFHDLLVLVGVLVGVIILLALLAGRVNMKKCPKCGIYVTSYKETKRLGLKSVNYYCHKCGWSPGNE